MSSVNKLKMPEKRDVVYGLWLPDAQDWVCCFDDDGSRLAYYSREQAEHGRKHQENLYDVQSVVAVMCGEEVKS